MANDLLQLFVSKEDTLYWGYDVTDNLNMKLLWHRDSKINHLSRNIAY